MDIPAETGITKYPENSQERHSRGVKLFVSFLVCAFALQMTGLLIGNGDLQKFLFGISSLLIAIICASGLYFLLKERSGSGFLNILFHSILCLAITLGFTVTAYDQIVSTVLASPKKGETAVIYPYSGSPYSVHTSSFKWPTSNIISVKDNYKFAGIAEIPIKAEDAYWFVTFNGTSSYNLSKVVDGSIKLNDLDSTLEWITDISGNEVSIIIKKVLDNRSAEFIPDRDEIYEIQEEVKKQSKCYLVKKGIILDSLNFESLTKGRRLD